MKKFIYTALLRPVQIQARFQEVLFFPVGGISVVMQCCQLNIIIFFVSELIQKQVKKFIYTALLQPVQIQAWFQEVLFFPVGGISVVMRKQTINGRILYSDIF